MMHEALTVAPDIDAIFCLNAGVLRASQSAGIKVSKQIAILGFHGLEMGQITTPRLASIGTARYEIGKTTTELLLASIKGNDVPRQIVVNTIRLPSDTLYCTNN